MKKNKEMKNIKFNFNWLKLILLFLVISLWPGGFAMPASSAVLFYENFEDALIVEGDWRYAINGGRTPIEGEVGGEISTDQKRTGSSSYKFYVYENGEGNYRSQLNLMNHFESGSSRFLIGEEYWTGFSIFLPDSYSSPVYPGGIQHLQYHMEGDKPPTCDPADGTRVPPVAIMIHSNSWDMWTRASSTLCQPVVEYEEKNSAVFGSISSGTWADFVINIKFGYDHDGFIKIWKNGVLEVDLADIGTCFNDIQGPYLGIGIYSHTLDPYQVVTIYYDEVKIGDSDSSYAEVAPGGKAPCAENWICEDWSDWSDCLDNQQFITRTCNDSNECGTEDDKPILIETQDCEIPPTYNLTNFIQLVSDWLKSETNLTSDLNNDNTVNARDLGIMMSHWE